jgi:hypothetical protein
MAESPSALTRAKRPGCEHQHDSEPDCQPAFDNIYRCTCGEEWGDVWSCACDDDCPRCGMTMTPRKSVQIAPCACDYLKG